MAMPSLALVSKEWEAEPSIRDHLRRFKCLLDWGADSEGKKVNIKNAPNNYHALAPLAKRLLDSNGEVGMHCIPRIPSQLLSLRNLERT